MIGPIIAYTASAVVVAGGVALVHEADTAQTAAQMNGRERAYGVALAGVGIFGAIATAMYQLSKKR